MIPRIITFCFACLFVISFTSCFKKTCSGYGTLQLCNESNNTYQQMLIDGTNYGTLDPGECKDISLAAGEHDFEMRGLTGGGCSAATVIIVECETEARTCRN